MKYLQMPHELGVLVEFYIPKKAEYQGPLHDHLRAALEPKRFRKVLRNEKGNILPALRKFLEWRQVRKPWDRVVADIPTDLFDGWSMYEVDGVFLDREKRPPQIFEERTQVVRLIIRPNLTEIGRVAGFKQGSGKELVRFLVREFMRHETARAEDLLAGFNKEAIARFPNRRALGNACRYIDRWITAAGVFVFGYLVWSVADAIGPREKIFLVTSVWALNINEITRQAKNG